MDRAVCKALGERLQETLNEFAEANEITVNEVLQTLDYVYAEIEVARGAVDWRKMH